jgi:hypothetical protein
MTILFNMIIYGRWSDHRLFMPFSGEIRLVQFLQRNIEVKSMTKWSNRYSCSHSAQHSNNAGQLLTSLTGAKCLTKYKL